MANSNDVDESRWVEDRLESLEVSPDFQADPVRLHARLRERMSMARTTVRRLRVVGAMTAVLVAVLALPGPRAAAQRLWNQLTLGRVAVVAIDRSDLPEDIAAVFAMQPQPWSQASVGSVDEAERIAGFRPLLPSPSVLNGRPTLSVIGSVSLSTKTLNTAEIEQVLAAAGVTDLAVPKQWEGTTLVAHGGPVVVAEYQDFELIQAAPFRMTTAAAFEFGRFMEIAFRVFGRDAGEARTLGRRFAANPALVMHFPKRGPVREVPLRSSTGVFVGDPNGSEGICFFWNTQDRIYVISADKMTEDQAAAVANSLE
jgi:hypothetical protein